MFDFMSRKTSKTVVNGNLRQTDFQRLRVRSVLEGGNFFSRLMLQDEKNVACRFALAVNQSISVIWQAKML